MFKKHIVVLGIIFFNLFFSNQVIVAQKNLKYKHVYKIIEDKSKEEAYSLLLIYQKQDPHFANTYFQLGMIAKYWSKDYDALTDIRDVFFFIYNTGLYFGLANLKIDEKEIRRNDDFYRNCEKFREVNKIKFEDVKSYVNEQIILNDEYKRNVGIVTNFYNSSITHYNSCISTFKEINRNNMKLKDILMTADDEFQKKLNKLENSFDSTIFYLQNYQTAIKNYPIKDHNQKYILLPIITYRLHGLTSSDFLQEEIHLWDYGTWVKDLKSTLNIDIYKLRKDINEANNNLDKYTNNIIQSKHKDEVKQYKVNEKLINRIGKYDYKSILAPLFKYKEAKQNFLAITKKPINDISDTTNTFSLVQRARYYNDLIKHKDFADSLNTEFGNIINSHDVNKYKQFFSENFNGETGLKKYSKNESVVLKSELDKAFNNFKDFLLKNTLNEISICNLPYKKTRIELKKANQQFETAKQDSFYVTSYSKDNNGNYYAAGYVKQRNPGVSAFLLKTSKLRRINWLKIYPIGKTSNDYGSYVQSTENGCELLISSIKDNEIKNHIFRVGKDGSKISKNELTTKLIPRYFNFDEINQIYTIAYKGMKTNEYDCLSDNLIISEYDGTTLSEKWSTFLNLKGNFVDIVKMNESFFVFTNFTKFASGSNIISSKAGVQANQTNSLLFVLDNFGKVKKTTPYFSESAFFIARALKVNSNTINLIGFKQGLVNTQTSAKRDFAKPLYLLVNTNGEIYYDNRDD